MQKARQKSTSSSSGKKRQAVGEGGRGRVVEKEEIQGGRANERLLTLEWSNMKRSSVRCGAC